MRRTFVVICAALVACGSSLGVHRAEAPPPLVVTWIGHLHEARAAIKMAALAQDGGGSRYIVYEDGGLPGGVASGHLQKRTADGTIAWDIELPWDVGAPHTGGMAVTLVGNVLLTVDGPVIFDVAGRTLALGSSQSAVVKLDGRDGSAAWAVQRDAPTRPEVRTDPQGSAIVAACARVTIEPWHLPEFACTSVSKYAWDGTPQWSYVLPTLGWGVSFAGDGAGGVFVASNDGTWEQDLGGMILKLDPAGDPVWSRVFEHFSVQWIEPTPDGGVVGWGKAAANARYDGTAVPVENGRRALFALASDGTSRGFRDAGFDLPLAVSPEGNVLALSALADGCTIHAVDPSGATIWSASLACQPSLWAYGGGGALTVGIATDAPFELFDTHIIPYDAQSPVIAGLRSR